MDPINYFRNSVKRRGNDDNKRLAFIHVPVLEPYYVQLFLKICYFRVGCLLAPKWIYFRKEKYDTDTANAIASSVTTVNLVVLLNGAPSRSVKSSVPKGSLIVSQNQYYWDFDRHNDISKGSGRRKI